MNILLTLLLAVVGGLFLSPLFLAIIDYISSGVYGKAIWKDDDLLEWLLINRDNFQYIDQGETILEFKYNDIQEFSCIYHSATSMAAKYVIKRIRGKSGFIIRGTKLHKAIGDIYKHAGKFERESKNWS